jgi:hypothetical protein
MKTFRSIATALFVALLAAPAAVGCTAATEEEPGSVAGIEIVAKVSSAVVADEVTKITVDVRGTSHSYFRAIELTRSGSTWTGKIESLLPGTYAFDARATDPWGGVRFIGQANDVVVKAGAETLLNLNLHQRWQDSPFFNTAPFIDMLSADKRIVAQNETITVAAAASDQDGDTPLGYTWDPGPGSVVSASTDGRSIQWKAPAADGIVELRVRVDDHHGGVSVGRLMLQVGTSTTAFGSLGVAASFIQAPRVTAMSVSNGQPYLNETIHLDALVEGPENITCDPATDAYCAPWHYVDWGTSCGTFATRQSDFRGGRTSADLTITSRDSTCWVWVYVFNDAYGTGNYGQTQIWLTAPQENVPQR